MLGLLWQIFEVICSVCSAHYRLFVIIKSPVITQISGEEENPSAKHVQFHQAIPYSSNVDLKGVAT